MDTYLGTVMPFPYGFVPKGWAPCNGQPLLISLNTALFSLLGTIYGGDGRTNFALPNLNGFNGNSAMVAAGQGDGPGLTSRAIGDTIGTETVMLMPEEMPLHAHDLGLFRAGATPSAVPTAGATLMAPTTNAYVVPPAPPLTLLTPSTVMPAGFGAPHDNLQPTLDLVFCICTVGDYPIFST